MLSANHFFLKVLQVYKLYPHSVFITEATTEYRPKTHFKMDPLRQYSSIDQAVLKIEQLEEQNQHLARELKRQEADFEEDKALLQQKAKFLQDMLSTAESKERSAQQKLKSVQLDHATTLQSMTANYETQLAALKTKIEDRTREINDLDTKLEEKERVIEDFTVRLEHKTVNSRSQVDELTKKNKQLEAELESFRHTHEQEVNSLHESHVAATARLRARLEETEKKLRSSEELLRNDMSIWDKDNAILVQKIEFLEQEIEDLRAKREEDKQYYQSMITALEAFKPQK